MLNRFTLKQLAKVAGRRQSDLVAMASCNDAYLADTPARLAGAEWFAELFSKFHLGMGVHLRQIHYKIVSQANPVKKPDGSDYENTEKCWKYLVNASRDARFQDLVPTGCFVDRRNPDPIINAEKMVLPSTDADRGGLHYEEIEEEFPWLPSYNVTVGKASSFCPYLIEIWAEKTTMNSILEPLCRSRGINLITGMGEMSETATRLLIERAISSQKPVRIFYISDFDPAGRSMPLAVSRRSQFMIDKLGIDVDFKLIPLVLTHEQCIELKLPRTPIKDTEKRGTKFEKRFGVGATELDALEALHPEKLKQIVIAAINRYSDPEYSRLLDSACMEYRHRLWNVEGLLSDVFGDVIEELKGERAAFVKQYAAFYEKATGAFENMREWLCMTDSYPGDFVPPAHRPANEFSDEQVLFDSKRDYLTQADAYNTFKNGIDDEDLEAVS
ncbi:MAG: hypothetical protein WCO00_17485 [Rhodospirillaceae bacterium]